MLRNAQQRQMRIALSSMVSRFACSTVPLRRHDDVDRCGAWIERDVGVAALHLSQHLRHLVLERRLVPAVVGPSRNTNDSITARRVSGSSWSAATRTGAPSSSSLCSAGSGSSSMAHHHTRWERDCCPGSGRPALTSELGVTALSVFAWVARGDEAPTATAIPGGDGRFGRHPRVHGHPTAVEP